MLLRGPRGAQFEFTPAAIAQNLRRLSKLVARPPPICSIAPLLRELCSGASRLAPTSPGASGKTAVS